jgi:serine/threonine-protein kinase
MVTTASAAAPLVNSGSSIVKQLRAAFESQLQTGGGSSIETWIVRVPMSERSALFAELLDAELSFHHRNGRLVLPQDYVARFPDRVTEIESVFQSWKKTFPNDVVGQTMDSTIDAPQLRQSEAKVWKEWRTGDFVRRYRLDDLLGSGAFGEVWKGFDPELRRSVAIKLPRKEVAGHFDLQSQFREEARRAASLKQEGIVPVYDIGQVGSGTYIVTEFIDGQTLAQRIKDGMLSRDQSLRIMRQMALTLHQAHRAGLVHRDSSRPTCCCVRRGLPRLPISASRSLSTNS